MTFRHRCFYWQSRFIFIYILSSLFPAQSIDPGDSAQRGMSTTIGAFSSNLQTIEDVRTISFAGLSALALLLFDHASTIDCEVDLFWNAPWTIPKAVYFWNRYFTLLIVGFDAWVGLRHSIPISACSKIILLRNLGNAIVSIQVDLILVLRLWILYDRPRRLLWLLSSLFQRPLPCWHSAFFGTVLSTLTLSLFPWGATPHLSRDASPTILFPFLQWHWAGF